MTVDNVIRLSASGLRNDFIIKKLRKKSQPFDLTSDQLVQLRSASVSERVLHAMLHLKGGHAPFPSEKTEPFTPQQATHTVLQDLPNSSLPAKIDVSAKRNGERVEELPEVVNWKTGSVIKQEATVMFVPTYRFNLDVLPIYIDGLAIRLYKGTESVTVQISVGVHELGFRHEKKSCILKVEPDGVYKVRVMPNADSPWGNPRLEAVN